MAIRGYAIISYYANYVAAAEDLERSILLFRQINDLGGLAEALLSLAYVETSRGRHDDAHQLLAWCNDLQAQASPKTRILYKIRLSYLLKIRGKPRESIHVLESLLGDPELLPFTHLRRIALQNMSNAYVLRGQLSRALRALNLAEDLIPDGDYNVKSSVALDAARYYLCQSRLNEALLCIRRGRHCLQSNYYDGETIADLHSTTGLYALASGDWEAAQIALNIALNFDSGSYNAYINRVRLARLELCCQRQASCLVLIQSIETIHLPAIFTLQFQLLRADRCFFIRDINQAIVHVILSLALARSISDDSLIAASLQRLGDIFMITHKDLSSANGCYRITMEIMKTASARRHVADCVLRLGILLLLEGKVADAKQKFTKTHLRASRRPTGIWLLRSYPSRV